MKRLLLSSVLASFIFAPPAVRADIDEDKLDYVCSETAEGTVVCVSAEDADPTAASSKWLAQGDDTYIIHNEYTGQAEVWHQISPTEYEILDQQTTQGMSGSHIGYLPSSCEAPLVSDPPDDVDGPEGPYEPPSDQPIQGHIAGYHFGAENWPQDKEHGGVSGRGSPYGTARLVASPPSQRQLEELEFAWALFKANMRRYKEELDGPLDALLVEVAVRGREANIALATYIAHDGYYTEDEIYAVGAIGSAFFEVAREHRQDMVKLTIDQLKCIADTTSMAETIRRFKDLVNPPPTQRFDPAVAAYHATIGDLLVEAVATGVYEYFEARGALAMNDVLDQLLADVYAAYAPVRTEILSGMVHQSELGGLALSPDAAFVIPTAASVGR
ncbi:MAG TPA: hypothetical protein PK095_09485 [Myxococcota bacterium]|nr:hypothetical protein [Myxococcota bacterium]